MPLRLLAEESNRTTSPVRSSPASTLLPCSSTNAVSDLKRHSNHFPELPGKQKKRVSYIYELADKIGVLNAYADINTNYARCATVVYKKTGKPILDESNYGLLLLRWRKQDSLRNTALQRPLHGSRKGPSEDPRISPEGRDRLLQVNRKQRLTSRLRPHSKQSESLFEQFTNSRIVKKICFFVFAQNVLLTSINRFSYYTRHFDEVPNASPFV